MVYVVRLYLSQCRRHSEHSDNDVCGASLILTDIMRFNLGHLRTSLINFNLWPIYWDSNWMHALWITNLNTKGVRGVDALLTWLLINKWLLHCYLNINYTYTCCLIDKFLVENTIHFTFWYIGLSRLYAANRIDITRSWIGRRLYVMYLLLAVMACFHWSTNNAVNHDALCDQLDKTSNSVNRPFKMNMKKHCFDKTESFKVQF